MASDTTTADAATAATTSDISAVDILLKAFNSSLPEEIRTTVEGIHRAMIPAVNDRDLKYKERCKRETARIAIFAPRSIGKTSALATLAAAILVGTTNRVSVLVENMEAGIKFLNLVRHVVPASINLRYFGRQIDYGAPKDRWIQFITCSEMGTRVSGMYGGESYGLCDRTIVLIDECMSWFSRNSLKWISGSNKFDPPSIVAIGTPIVEYCPFRDVVASDPTVWTTVMMNHQPECSSYDDCDCARDGDADVQEGAVVVLST